jgi:hypothetical protein
MLVVTAIVIAGCGLLPSAEELRTQAFIDSANADPQDPEEMQSHFHPTKVEEYSTMNTEPYWSGTFFKPSDQPFALGTLTAGTGVAGYPDTISSLSGTISSGQISDRDITIGFVEDPDNPSNRLIRVILIDDGGTEEIKNVH